MFRMSHDAVDFFSADFTSAGVIVAGEEYPLGYFAAEALEVSGQLTLDIGAAAKEFAAEAQMFFAAGTRPARGSPTRRFGGCGICCGSCRCMSFFCGGRMRRPASPATRTAGRCGTR